MNDEHLLELISRSLDEPLTQAEQQELDAALADTPELRELAKDLATLKDMAAMPAPEPPADAFANLEARVKEAWPRRRFRVIPGGWIAPALALAALLTLGLLGIFQGKQAEPDPALEQASAIAEARAQLDLAKANFHAAIARMENLAMERMDDLPPDVAHNYMRSLAVIDDAIRDCERMSHENPGNAVSYMALTQSYDAKVRLLEMILKS